MQCDVVSHFKKIQLDGVGQLFLAQHPSRHAINFAYLSDIKNTISGTTTLQEVQKTSDRMFTEMRGYAEAASFDELSRITAKDALDKFIQKPDLLDRP